MPLTKKSKRRVLRKRKGSAKPIKRSLKKRTGRSTLWLRKGKPGKGKLLRRKLRRRRTVLRSRRPAAVQPQPAVVPVDTADLYQEGYNETYQEGFNTGFAQGFEDGHKLAYQEQELKA